MRPFTWSFKLGDTLTNILIPGEEWIDVYSFSIILPGVPIEIQNIGVTDLYYAIADEQPARDYDRYKIFKRGEKISLSGGDEAVWLFSTQIDGKINADVLNYVAPSLLDIAKGNVPGHELVGIIARNPTVGTEWEDLWGPSIPHVEPVSEQSWRLVFNAPEDTFNGDGAQEVLVLYADGGYQFKTVIKQSNGGIVNLNDDHYRPISMIVTRTGSLSSNAATVTLENTAGEVQGEIPFSDVGFCLSQDGHYTVEEGKVGFGLQIIPFFPKDEDGYFRTILQTEGGPRYIGAELPFYQSGVPIEILAPFSLPERTDINFQCRTSNEDVLVTLSATLLIVDKNLVGLSSPLVNSFATRFL